MDILTICVEFVENYLQLRGELISPPKERKRHRRKESTSDEEVEPDIREKKTECEFVEFAKHFDDRFLRAVPFIRSGLKASVRAAEFPSLGILAGSLEAGIR
jgi:hypothetical protein